MQRARNWIWAALAAGAVAILAVVISLNANALFGAGGSAVPATSGTATESSAAASSPSPSPLTTPSKTATPIPTSIPTPTVAKSLAELALASLTPAQKVGQVLMVSSPVNGIDAAALNDLSALQVGNVFLKGRSFAGAAAVKSQVEQLNRVVTAANAGIKPYVATDQEGGAVQILSGPGFSAIPSALDQGTMAPATLQNSAHGWGTELAAAGVNVNFAPVADTVPGPAAAATNPPIGVFGREYGYSPEAVAAHAAAFAAGLSSAGIVPTAKHFPNLGRVNANTDTTAAVTDPITVRHDPAVEAFRAVIKDGKSWLMMSSAYYPQIDPDHIAPFSSLMMRSMVRGDLGFQGVIVSDDICDARQLSPFPATERAADFIAAGGTLALCTNQSTLPALHQGLLARYRADPGFAAVVDQAALKMLQAKQASQLLPNS